MPSTEQRMEALEKANEVRSARATMRKAVKAGQNPLPLLLYPPHCLVGVPINEFLMWVPAVGRRKAITLTRGIGAFSDSIPLGKLSESSKHELHDRLAVWMEGRPVRGQDARMGTGKMRQQEQPVAA